MQLPVCRQLLSENREMSPSVSVIVIEDDAIVRSWVREALRESAYRIAGEAETAIEAAELVGRRHADLLLVDQHLPDQLGTEFVRDLRRRGDGIPVVLMTASAEQGLNEVAREAGAQASVVKSSEVERLIEVLDAVSSGGVLFDAAHPRRPDDEAPLAPREREAIGLAAQGLTNKEIAIGLGISAETVKTLLERAFVKLGAHRRAEAVLEARRRGIV
jgi:DNA-binding NarL/FixJ family response regulator